MRKGLLVGAMVALGALIMAGTPGLAGVPQQKDKSQRPSPPAKAEGKLGGGVTITVDYSSPRMKGRQIFGGLVPYGQVWRAGANEATTLVTSGNIRVGSLDVPAGTYTLFTIPDKGKWTLIVSKKTGEWGVPYPGEAEDFGRTEMHVKALPSPVENFEIGLKQEGGALVLHMDWETTSASVKITEKK